MTVKSHDASHSLISFAGALVGLGFGLLFLFALFVINPKRTMPSLWIMALFTAVAASTGCALACTRSTLLTRERQLQCTKCD